MFAAVDGALRDVGSDELADRYRFGPWGLPSAQDIDQLIRTAGFEHVRVQRHTVPVVFEGGATQFISTLAASGIAGEIAALAPERQAELLQAFTARVAPISGDGAIHSPTTAHIALARR